MSVFLFVYGTLQNGYKHRMARYLAGCARFICRAQVPGRLYALRRYPALRPARSPEDAVPGDLYQLRQPHATLPVLDAYEDRQYRRVLTRATLADGRAVRAWTYEWKTPIPEHRRVPHWP